MICFSRPDIATASWKGENFTSLKERGMIAEFVVAELGFFMRCITYNPPHKSRPGPLGAVRSKCGILCPSFDDCKCLR